MKLFSKKNLLRLAAVGCFALLALGLIAYTDRVLWDKNGTIMGFYEEPRNTVDVLYLGGSHSNAAVSPTQIYEEQGFTGYVLYSWSQPIWTSYHYLVEGLKTQRPSVVVLDAFGLVYGNTYMTDVDMNSVSDDYSLLIPPSLNRVELAVSMSRAQTEHRPFYSYFSLFRYHNRWKALTAEDVLWPLQSYRTSGKGFGPLYTTEVYDQHQPESIVPNELMYRWSRVYLQKIIDLCKQQNIELVLTNFPYIAEDAEYGIYADARSYCEAQGVPFVDYLLDETAAEAGFDYGTDMAEHAHVNYKGAHKLSAHLGGWLAEHYDLPDRRNDPAFSDWAQDAAKEERNLQDMDLCMTLDLDALLNKAETGDYIVLMAVCGDLRAEGADPAETAAVLAAHGYDSSIFETGGSAIYCWNGGSESKLSHQCGDMGSSLTAADGTELTVSITGETSAILVKEKASEALADFSRNRPGLNIVVADARTGRLVYSVSYSPIHGYTAFTA